MLNTSVSGSDTSSKLSPPSALRLSPPPRQPTYTVSPSSARHCAPEPCKRVDPPTLTNASPVVANNSIHTGSRIIAMCTSSRPADRARRRSGATRAGVTGRAAARAAGVVLPPPSAPAYSSGSYEASRMVVVGVAAFDADVSGLVPLLDQLGAVGGKPVAQRENGVAVGQSHTL